MMTRHLVDPSLPLAMLAMAGALAMPAPAAAALSASSRRIDPLLRAERASGRSAEQEVAAVLRLPQATPSQLDALEREGVRFRRHPDGRRRHLGDLYPVDATTDVLATIARRGISVRVSRAMPMELSLYPTGEEIEARALWGYGPTPAFGGAEVPVTVGSVDSGIDIFHPHYFRADGGAVPWIDVDGDQTFTPGIDAVDANLDGEVGPQEALQLLDYGFNVGAAVHGYGGDFETAWDYLYLDLNGNGRRDHGPAAGFSETTPGYGEAMFLPDDANGDGVLGIDERVILLGTSQIKALNTGSAVYTRGVDLITAPSLVTTHQLARHGTATTGPIAGGQAHPFRANRGGVPNADIAMLASSAFAETGEAEVEFVEGMEWLVDEMEAVVVNHSWETRADRIHLDGSGFIDSVIDAASAQGSTQVCAAGNRWALGKHHQQMTEDDAVSFSATMPSLPGFNPTSITFDLHWPASEGSLACTVQRPDGLTHEVEEVPDAAFDDLVVDAFRSDSARGWALLSIEISTADGSLIGPGDWQLDCRHTGPSAPLVHGVVSDGISYGQAGAAFTSATPSSTAVSPAIADTCISVAGYPIQHPQAPGSSIGQLEPYSSHGPRFDGAPVVDVAAPVDSVVPYGAHPEGLANAYVAFVGTSGAAPQVSAVVGLMRALDDTLEPAQIRDMIRAGAEVDADVVVDQIPDDGWGYGKLRGYRALTGEAPAAPPPSPVPIAITVDYAYADGDCEAFLGVDGVTWSAASLRWDLDYDGFWDTDFGSTGEQIVVLTEPGEPLNVRVDAANGGTIVAGATLAGSAPAECFEAPPPGLDTGTGTASGDTGGGDSTGGDDAGAGDEAPGGCGCRQSSSPGPAGVLLGLVVAHRRRRRRR